jgi:hypothetical protein
MLQGAFKLDLFLLEGLNSDSIQSPYPKDIPAGTGCRMNVTISDGSNSGSAFDRLLVILLRF